MRTAVAIETVALPPTLAPAHPDYTRERYAVDQAAAYLQINRSRIYALCAARELAHRVDGGRKRFSQADLDAWRAARRIDTAERAPRPRAVVARLAAPATLPPVKHPRFG